MNKHVRNVIFAVGILLLGLSWALPAVSSAAPSYDVAIPLEYARVKPKAAGADCNAVSPVKKTKVTGDDCIKIPNATGTSAGVYYFVSKLEQIPKASISGVSVTSIASSGTAAGSPVAGIKYSVVNNELRISGLKKGEAYSFSFSFSDSESPDIQKLQSNIKKECDYFTQHDTTKPSLNYQTNDKNAQRAAFKLQDFDGENDLGNGTTFGCTQYSSAQVLSGTNADEAFQFLPPIALTTLDNDGNGYTFTHAGQKLGAVDLSKQVANAVPSTATATSSTSSTSSTAAAQCGDGNPLTWIICPISSGLGGFVEFMGQQIGNLLFTSTDAIFTDQMQQAWTTFRNIGLGLVLIAGLVMVISQALGLELLDAYTIRKLMPRLAIALIGIALSWSLLKLTITFVDDIGLWIYDVIIKPFSNMPGIGGISGGKQWGLFLGGGFTALIIGLFSGLDLVALGMFMVTIALAVVIGLIVLGVRQVVIMMGILLAPLAIAAYVLPGTQKLWGFWKNTLLTSLIMFPIIMGFLAAGDAMSRVALAAGMNTILALIIYFAPYFMLPFAFKMAGGLMSTIFSLANDRSRGVFDRLGKARQNRMARNSEAVRGGYRFRNTSRTGNLINRMSKRAYDETQTFGLTRGARQRRREAYHSNHGFHAAMQIRKDHGDMMVDDSLNNAILESDGSLDSITQNLIAAGFEGDRLTAAQGTAERLMKTGSRQDVMAALAMANVPTGSGYRDNEHMLRTIARVSGGNTDLATKMLGTMRGEAKQVGRSDLGGTRFSKQAQYLLDEMEHEGAGTNEAAARDMALSALSQTDLATIARERPEAIRAYARHIPAIIDDLRRNPRNITMDDGTVASSEDVIGRLTATMANLTDSTREYGALDRAHVAHEATEQIAGDAYQAEVDATPGFTGPRLPDGRISPNSPPTGTDDETAEEFQSHRSRYGTYDPRNPNRQQAEAPPPPDEP